MIVAGSWSVVESGVGWMPSIRSIVAAMLAESWVV